ncbi:MAG: hypothetical protein WCX27_02110 [Candidatus Paceibacterota bacterium]|jgi:hypothetical protein
MLILQAESSYTEDLIMVLPKLLKKAPETLSAAKMLEKFWSLDRKLEERTVQATKKQTQEALEETKREWRRFSIKFGNRLENGSGIKTFIQMVNVHKNHEKKGYVVLLDLIRRNKGIQGEVPDTFVNIHKK